MGLPLEMMAATLAGDVAFSAEDTFFRIKKDLGIGGLGFGVMTPEAIQRTTFHKNSSANAGAVVNAKFLDIKNGTFHKVSTFLFEK